MKIKLAHLVQLQKALEQLLGIGCFIFHCSSVSLWVAILSVVLPGLSFVGVFFLCPFMPLSRLVLSLL